MGTGQEKDRIGYRIERDIERASFYALGNASTRIGMEGVEVVFANIYDRVCVAICG
jgi:hypothetical protein